MMRRNTLVLLVVASCSSEPLAVSPILTARSQGLVGAEIWQADGESADVELGRAVAWAGDVNGDGFGDFIVAAPTLPGEVRVYYGSAGAVSGPTVLSGQAGSHFGSSVASAGDVDGDGYADVVVGAPMHQGNGGFTLGAAFVFHGGPEGVETSARWIQDGSTNASQYGFAVASAGDVNRDGFSDVLVGSPEYSSGQGAVLLYVGGAAGLAASPVVISRAGVTQFGRAVASAGDVNGDGFSDIVVGAPTHDDGHGWAAVYRGSDTPSDGLSLFWEASGATNSAFGTSVAGVGDFNGDGYGDLLVGAPAADSIHLYAGGSMTMPATPLDSFQGAVGGGLGSAVAAAGDANGDGFADLIVGSPNAGDGRAALYFGNDNGLLNQEWRREASGEQLLGAAVSAAGDVNGDGLGDILIGIPGMDAGEADVGRAVLILGIAGPVPGTASSTAWGDASDQLGRSLAFIDLRGDGLDEVVKGAPYAFGSGEVVFPTSSLAAPANAAAFGWAVLNTGDVDGNGYADLLVGAPDSTSPGRTGAVFLYLADAGGVEGLPDNRFDGIQVNGDFGIAIGGGCDINGDGLSDMIIGAPRHSDGETDEGVVFVVYGSTGSFDMTAPLLQIDQAAAEFGAAVTCAGDLNGDGFGDLAVGAPGFSNGHPGEGAVFVYFGDADGLSPPIRREADVVGAGMGEAVAAAGDVNGDGLDDLLVGTPAFDGTDVNDMGRVYLFLGDAGGLAATAVWTQDGANESDRFGASVSSAGDTNGDGLADVVVGADGEAGEGRARLFLGTQSGVLLASTVLDDGSAIGSLFGASAAAGDTNGDGYSDIAVGAPRYGAGATDTGAVSVFLGNNGDASHSATPFAARAEAVVPWGVTPNPHELGVVARVQSPFGRSRAKLQVEVQPHPDPFTQADLAAGTDWVDTGSAASGASTRVRGLPGGAPYRWRARVLYDPALAHPQGWSHWFQGGVGGSPQGVHFRTAPCQFLQDLDNTCDLVDDNCNGEFDEDYQAPTIPCGVGACAAEGERICEWGATIDVCQPGTPAASDANCDGVDDDCNGEQDDGFVSLPTTCGLGVCESAGQIDCLSGDTVTVCTPGLPLSSEDVTCDGVDDDCDGFYDDDVDVTTACSPGGPCDIVVCNPFGGGCQSSRLTGCCAADADCIVSSSCLQASCDRQTASCIQAAIEGCCTNAGDCNDDNACTEDRCVGATCANQPVDGCCHSDADCDDEDPCTFDQCTTNRCQHSPTACGTGSPCGDDASCWYSNLVVSRGALSPEGAQVTAGDPVPVLQLVLTNHALEGDLQRLRLSLTNWTPVFADTGEVTVALYRDSDGDGQLEAAGSPLASATVTSSASYVDLEGIGYHLPAAAVEHLLVVVSVSEPVGAWLLLPVLALAGFLCWRRRLWLALAGLLLVLACSYNVAGLPLSAAVSIAEEEHVSVVARDPGARIWVRGTPVESHPFAVE